MTDTTAKPTKVKNTKVLLINPEKNPHGVSWPFMTLVDELLVQGLEVHYVSFHALNLESNENLFAHLPRQSKFSRMEVIPGWRYLIYIFFPALFLALSKKFSAIAVFSFKDSVANALASFVGRAPLILFADCVPWSAREVLTATKLATRPRLFLRVMGAYAATKIIVPANAVKAEFEKSLPGLKNKICTLPYTVDFNAEDILSSSGSKKVILHSSEDSFLLVVQDNFFSRRRLEQVARAIALLEDESFQLLVNNGVGKEKNSFFSIVASLELGQQVDEAPNNTLFIELIEQCDALLCLGIFPETAVNVAAAIAYDKLVIAPKSEAFRELLADEDLLFEFGNVQELSELLYKLRNDKAWGSAAQRKLKERFAKIPNKWSAEAVKIVAGAGK